MKNFSKNISGILLCILIGVVSFFLAKYIKIGAVTLAIIIGLIIGNSAKLGKKIQYGINFSEKDILALAIALMGVNLDFTILGELGFRSILLVISGIFMTIFSAIFLGKVFKFDAKFALLLGIGNGICGSSAIAATKNIVKANDEQVGLSVAIVNFLGTIGIFLLPFIATKILNFAGIPSGVLIGNTLQAVGQVVAAGFSISDSVGETATIIKMTRILMLTPIIFILIYSFRGKSRENKPRQKIKIPLFIIGFILLSLIPTFELFPESVIKIISQIGKYLLIIAMAGIGLKITFSSILKNGKKALLVGSLVFLVQIIFTSGLVFLFF